jgi:hypothetical protein
MSKINNTKKAYILVKYSASKCNKSLLDFIHTHKNKIGKIFNLNVVIVYDDMIAKLDSKIKHLPVLIIPGNFITGNKSIKEYIIKTIAPPGNKQKQQQQKQKGVASVSELDDFWNNEMHNNTEDNECEGDNIMDNVRDKAIEQSIQHQKSAAPKRKKLTPSKYNDKDNVKVGNIKTGKISDMIEGGGNEAKMMKQFWDNQENTPGFEGTGGEDIGDVGDSEF